MNRAALLALLVAVALLANPLYLFPHPGESEYFHSTEAIDRSEIPEDATLLQYAELSPEARHAIDEALASPDNTATIHGEADKPPEFFYSDYAKVGQGVYFVEKDGTTYRLTTYAGGGLFPADLFAALALAMAGLAVATGGLATHRDASDPRYVAGVGAVTLLATATATTTVGDVVGMLLALVGLAATTSASAATTADRWTLGALSAMLIVALAANVVRGYGPMSPVGAIPLVVATVGALVGVGGRQLRAHLG